MIEVTVFDGVFLIPSFWVLGFMRLEQEGKIRLRWRRGAASPIPHEVTKWKSVAFIARDRGIERLGYIDIFDSYRSLERKTIEQVDAYFKFNYRPPHIAEVLPAALANKVHPTGFYFPVKLERQAGLPLALVAAARAGFFACAHRSTVERLKDARASVRQRYELHTRYSALEDYLERLAPIRERVLDVFWNVSYWPAKFDKGESKSTQRVDVMRVLAKIKASSSYRMEFGFVDKPEARQAHPDYVLSPSPTTREYLERLARTKLSIATRGLEECFSWRVGEHLALRRFVLLEKFYNTPRIPLKDGHDAVFFESDLSDLEHKIRWYLEHEAEREAIAARGGAYFQRHCLPHQQISAMLETLFARGS